ncbi:hypothetical protein UT300012_15400 [Paraclostridium bifermentans]|uniref:hypothetical protein n=1 Tax=Paraclostridium bifermentans TaxID=1490 RepID=UPI000DF7FA7E|nr:hypothetical protein [Paraclostridium bifermentans]MBU5286633.1 hypothetical protein [Paraclostridium bifermentans]RDC51221.1 hypothetical protein DVA85_14720 [Acinetobacter sp. RIT592]
MDFITLIQNVGFPIACCAALGYYLNNKDKADREERKEDKIADRIREDKILETNAKLLATNEQLAESVEIIAKDMRNDITRTENKIDKILEKVGAKYE